MTSLVELIAKKRDGLEHTDDEIRRIIASYVEGQLADYQMSAWLMAVFLRGMTDAETNALTDAMLRSGEVLDLSSVPGLKVDKHSTGGVGDKVSICLAPLVAACGVPVPMVSGRGLGHTGGTLDKLEAIPGFRVDLDVAAFAETVRTVGASMIGQTAQIAPADKRIYALRDVTATVECIPLIVASILSKKLAEGIDGLVLDVKVGRGAFMKDEARARELAEALVRVGKRAGKRVVALLTDMSAPLGATIGNALETREAIDVLHGKGPEDLVACTFALGAEMLMLGGKAKDYAEAEAQMRAAIESGKAAQAMRDLIKAHHGDPRVVDDTSLLPTAPITVDINAERAGWVTGIDPLELGLAAVQLGAGRTRTDQQVDHDVGIELTVARGSKVKKGVTLARVHVRNKASAKAVEARIRGAFTIADASFPPPPLVLSRIELANVLRGQGSRRCASSRAVALSSPRPRSPPRGPRASHGPSVEPCKQRRDRGRGDGPCKIQSESVSRCTWSSRTIARASRPRRCAERSSIRCSTPAQERCGAPRPAIATWPGRWLCAIASCAAGCRPTTPTEPRTQNSSRTCRPSS